MNKRIGLYIRVSTTEQSTELQRQELEAYAKAREWECIAFYEDKASGTNANRPMLKKLMSDARQRKLDCIVVWKLDRFFRSLKDLVTTLQELSELGIQFISMKDQIDLGTASGRLLMHVVGAMGEFEGALIRERVKSGLKAAKAKGTVLGRPTQIDTAKVIELRKQGLSLTEIGQRINASKSGVSKTLAKVAVSKR
jgi:DNA invertase Pin-like site-specific DNA recombinase